MAQLRKDYNLALPQNKDSEYQQIVREERVFPNLVISKVIYKSICRHWKMLFPLSLKTK